MPFGSGALGASLAVLRGRRIRKGHCKEHVRGVGSVGVLRVVPHSPSRALPRRLRLQPDARVRVGRARGVLLFGVRQRSRPMPYALG